MNVQRSIRPIPWRVFAGALLLVSICCHADLSPVAAAVPGSTSTCDSLPEADERVPWSDEWRDIRYSPDGRAVALTGLRELYQIELRDPDVHTPEEVTTGVSILVWSPDGSTRAIAAPFGYSGYECPGSWSADGRSYAQVLSMNRERWLFVLDLESGRWSPVVFLGLSWFSTPAWNPATDEIAIAQVDMTQRLVYVTVVDRIGQVVRENALDVAVEGIRSVELSWSSEGRFLALTCWNDMSRAKISVLSVDSLDVLDSVRAAMNGSGWQDAPLWSPVGRKLAFVDRGLRILELSTDGLCVDDRTEPFPAGVIQMAWFPTGNGLLVFGSKQAPDAIELLDTIRTIGENTPHRRIYSTWIFDLVTRQASECQELRQVNRDVSWHAPWMVPRVAEGIARWTR